MTRDETPAALLRRAAQRVREAAQGTTAGPWQWSTWRCPAVDGGPHRVNCPGVDELVHEFESSTGWPVHPANVLKVSHSDWPASAADQEWIALTSPQVAEPLAAWLETEAKVANRRHAADTHPALLLARVVLGEEPVS